MSEIRLRTEFLIGIYLPPTVGLPARTRLSIEDFKVLVAAGF
jgi:hypothetical protein